MLLKAAGVEPLDWWEQLFPPVYIFWLSPNSDSVCFLLGNGATQKLHGGSFRVPWWKRSRLMCVCLLSESVASSGMWNNDSFQVARAGGGIGLDGRQEARLAAQLLALDLAALSQGEADTLRLLSQHMSAWLVGPAGQVQPPEASSQAQVHSGHWLQRAAGFGVRAFSWLIDSVREGVPLSSGASTDLTIY